MFHVIEDAVMENGDILVVNGKRAFLYHNGVWTEIPDYAERASALMEKLLSEIPSIPPR